MSGRNSKEIKPLIIYLVYDIDTMCIQERSCSLWAGKTICFRRKNREDMTQKIIFGQPDVDTANLI